MPYTQRMDEIAGRNLPIGEAVVALAEMYTELFEMSTEEINNGSCWEFAADLHKLFPESISTDNHKLSGLDYPDVDWSHAFVLYNGLYYDSETPDGVADWMDLPCCQRCTQYPADARSATN